MGILLSRVRLICLISLLCWGLAGVLEARAEPMEFTQYWPQELFVRGASESAHIFQEATGYPVSCDGISSRDSYTCEQRLARLADLARHVPKKKNFTHVYVTDENAGINFGGRVFVEVSMRVSDDDILNYLASLQTLPKLYPSNEKHIREWFQMQSKILHQTGYLAVCEENRFEWEQSTRSWYVAGLAPDICSEAYKNLLNFFRRQKKLIGKDIRGVFISSTDKIPVELQMQDDPSLDIFGYIWVDYKALLTPEDHASDHSIQHFIEILAKRVSGSANRERLSGYVRALERGD